MRKLQDIEDPLAELAKRINSAVEFCPWVEDGERIGVYHRVINVSSLYSIRPSRPGGYEMPAERVGHFGFQALMDIKNAVDELVEEYSHAIEDQEAGTGDACGLRREEHAGHS